MLTPSRHPGGDAGKFNVVPHRVGIAGWNQSELRHPCQAHAHGEDLDDALLLPFTLLDTLQDATTVGL